MKNLTKVRLTSDDLDKLDKLGHRELEDLTEIQKLDEYAIMLLIRCQGVLERIRELRGKA